MRAFLQFAIALNLTAGLLLTPPLTQAFAEEPAKSADEKPADVKKFDDWQVACGTPKGGTKKVCQAIQTLTNDKDGKRVMQIMVGFPDSSADPVAVFILPLGYLLQQGAKLSLDGKEIGALGAERCLQTGCLVPVILDKDMLAKFKAGNSGKVVVNISKEQAVDLPVSLKGFSSALAELKKG